MWMFHWSIQAIGRPSYTLFRVRSVLEVLFLESFIELLASCSLARPSDRRTIGPCPFVRVRSGDSTESDGTGNPDVEDRYLAATAMMHVSQPIVNEWPTKPPF